MTPQELLDLHEEAMELSFEASHALVRKDEVKFRDLMTQALEKEREAAFFLKDRLEVEPTRSILFRSAASMAYQLGKYREAEQLIAWGLAGNPTEYEAEILREVYDDVNYHRHLDIKGYIPQENEFTMSFAQGKGVGHGSVAINISTPRIKTLQNIIYRTAERLTGSSFHAGQPPAPIKELYTLQQIHTAAASYAIVFALPNQPKQLSLSFESPETSLPKTSQVIKEVITGIDRINNERWQELQHQIPDESYYLNFIALTKELAPDGSNLHSLAFGYKTEDDDYQVRMDKTKKQIILPVKRNKDQNVDNKPFDITGKLTRANSEQKLLGVEGSTYKIKVDEELEDIVKNHFSDEVIATIQKDAKYSYYHLIDINPL